MLTEQQCSHHDSLWSSHFTVIVSHSWHTKYTYNLWIVCLKAPVSTPTPHKCQYDTTDLLICSLRLEGRELFAEGQGPEHKRKMLCMLLT